MQLFLHGCSYKYALRCTYAADGIKGLVQSSIVAVPSKNIRHTSWFPESKPMTALPCKYERGMGLVGYHFIFFIDLPV